MRDVITSGGLGSDVGEVGKEEYWDRRAFKSDLPSMQRLSYVPDRETLAMGSLADCSADGMDIYNVLPRKKAVAIRVSEVFLVSTQPTEPRKATHGSMTADSFFFSI